MGSARILCMANDVDGERGNLHAVSESKDRNYIESRRGVLEGHRQLITRV